MKTGNDNVMASKIAHTEATKYQNQFPDDNSYISYRRGFYHGAVWQREQYKPLVEALREYIADLGALASWQQEQNKWDDVRSRQDKYRELLKQIEKDT